MAQENRTMPKLRTSEIIDLIGSIDDSILMNWERQSDRGEPYQFPGWKELPPVKDRQGSLQTIDMMLALSESWSSKSYRLKVKEDRGSESEE
jgi:hypothetical protein